MKEAMRESDGISKILLNHNQSPQKLSMSPRIINEDSAEVLDTIMNEIQEENKPFDSTKIISFKGG